MTDFDVDALLEQQLEAQQAEAKTDEGRSGKRSDTGEARDRDRERKSDRRSDRDKDRDRDHDRRSDRHRSRDRDRERDHGRSRDRDPDRRDRDRHRSRDGSRERGSSRRQRSASRDRDRDDRSHGRSHRDTRAERSDRTPSDRRPDKDLRDRGRDRDRPRAPPKPRTPTPERELRRMQREACTIMAYGLSQFADEFDVFTFFSEAGELVDVKLIRDKTTQRSKGIAYIEYKNRADIMNALQLNGKVLKGVSVMVKSSEAEKNFAWESQQLQARQNKLSLQAMDPDSASLQAGGPCRLRVANLPEVGITEDDIKQLFEPFGHVQSVTFERVGGRFTGVAFVQYPTSPEGTKARQQLSGTELMPGQPLHITNADAQNTYGGHHQVSSVVTAGELDEGDETGGLRMNASSRTALMARMSGAAGIEALRPKEEVLPPPPAKPAAPQIKIDPAIEMDPGLIGSASPIPTPCLLLKNMFDPAGESGPGWPEEIKEDALSACSEFGRVLHCFLDDKSKGFVYVKMESVEAASAAFATLHGRWYSNKQIYACYQFQQMYDRHFGL